MDRNGIQKSGLETVVQAETRTDLACEAGRTVAREKTRTETVGNREVQVTRSRETDGSRYVTLTCGLLTDWDGEALTELARITAYELRTLAVLTVGHSIERDTRILIAGIGNRRTALNRETVGCPVLSVGIPTVVDSGTLLRDALAQAGLDAENVPQALQDVLTAGQSFIVTPRDCDAVTECTAILLARAVDAAFGIDRESVKTDGDD